MSTTAAQEPLRWSELEALVLPEPDLVNGSTSSQAILRLFGQTESGVRITFYRDRHAWCPYCQKVWLWLELSRVPYRVKKVNMRCYGSKETWFLQKVRSGMLPVLDLDGRLIKESDVILLELEKAFKPLGTMLNSSYAFRIRNLERLLFHSWCAWLCNPGLSEQREKQAKKQFQEVAYQVEAEMSPGPWIDPATYIDGRIGPGSLDIIFIPYLERMNASLAYYKGYLLREEHLGIHRWFCSLERLKTYRGTQSDFHTHAHDLPPQMGGCWKSDSAGQREIAHQIDIGNGMGERESSWIDADLNDQAKIALGRVFKHRDSLLRVNPLGSSNFDQPLRCALTKLITGKLVQPTVGSAPGLRYLRDRISVPRDMPLLAARLLRQSLEATASLDGSGQGKPIPLRNRLDQDPMSFQGNPRFSKRERN
ncbi:glutathione S-transferase family protein [cyanobiont of Ornithocercus magnificus]|nr:glutathione S-transferase family protein [cyanobiont of Ornithocercus magnificus]